MYIPHDGSSFFRLDKNEKSGVDSRFSFSTSAPIPLGRQQQGTLVFLNWSMWAPGYSLLCERTIPSYLLRDWAPLRPSRAGPPEAAACMFLPPHPGRRCDVGVIYIWYMFTCIKERRFP